MNRLWQIISPCLLFSHEKDKILQFLTTQVDLEGIMLSEISQMEKTNTVCLDLYVELKKKKKTHIRETDSQIQKTNQQLPERKAVVGGVKWVKRIKRYKLSSVQFSSDAQLCPTLGDSMHARFPCPSPTLFVDCSNSYLSIR